MMWVSLLSLLGMICTLLPCKGMILKSCIPRTSDILSDILGSKCTAYIQARFSVYNSFLKRDKIVQCEHNFLVSIVCD